MGDRTGTQIDEEGSNKHRTMRGYKGSEYNKKVSKHNREDSKYNREVIINRRSQHRQW